MLMILKVIDKRNGKHYLDGKLITSKVLSDFISQLEERGKDLNLFATLGSNPTYETAAILESIEIKKDGVYAKFKVIETPRGNLLKGILEGQKEYNKPCETKHIGIAPRMVGSSKEHINILFLRVLNWFWITKFIRKKSTKVDNFFKKYTIQKITDGKFLGFDIVAMPTNVNTVLIEN